MIRRPRQGNEATAQLAERLGCTLVEAVPRHGHARPALVGCDAELAERLKALGARWDSFNQALAFAGWPALQAALRYALDLQGAPDTPQPQPPRSQDHPSKEQHAWTPPHPPSTNASSPSATSAGSSCAAPSGSTTRPTGPW